MIWIFHRFLIFCIRHLMMQILKGCKYLKTKVQYLKLRFRNKKETEVAKKVIEEIEKMVDEPNGNVANPVELTLTLEAAVLPKDKAYGKVFDPATNKWLAVEILYDYQSGTLGGIKVVEQNPQERIINERFHVLIGQNLL